MHLPSKEALVLATRRHKQEQWTGVVMAAVLRRPRALDQLDAMVEAIEVDEDRSSADAVWQRSPPGTRRRR